MARTRIVLHFTDADKAVARQLLANCPIPRDRLPYTPDFETLYAAFLSQTGRQIERAVFWRLLSSAAKQGGLARQRGRPIA